MSIFSAMEFSTFKKIATLVLVLSFNSTYAVTEVGRIPGSFNVSSSGAATYSMNIEVPPGVNGLKPSLSLSYSSQSGNGPLGYGWGLSGTSSIARCNKNYAQDNGFVNVDFSNTDRLCLDGQRLILVNGNNTNDNEYWSSYAEYRTEKESFSKVTRYGSGFKVETKDGRVAEYGLTHDSSQQLKIVSSGALYVLNWAINKITDLSGNTLKYSYIENLENSNHLLKDIIYGPNNSVSVNFIYDTNRSDAHTTYKSGAKYSEQYRLNKISVKLSGVEKTSYNLSYKQVLTPSKSFLSEVEKCISGSCLKKTVFTPEQEDSPAKLFTTYKAKKVQNGVGGTYHKQQGDYNGDGIGDVAITHWSSTYGWVIYTSTGIGDGNFNPAVRSKPSSGTHGNYEQMQGDFNGDGIADFANVHFSSTYGWVIYTALGQENGIFSSAGYSKPFNGTNGEYTKHSGDYNADGITDLSLIHWSSTYGWIVYTALGQADGKFTSFKYSKPFSGTSGVYKHLQGDFNGDGVTDLARSHFSSTYGWIVYTSLGRGDGTFESAVRSYPFSGTNGSYTSIAGDYNGDGITDLALTHWSKTYGWLIYTSLGRGDGTFAASQFSKVLNVGGGAYEQQYGDFNGDGVSDFANVHFSSKYGWIIYTALGNGDGTFAYATHNKPFNGTGGAYTKHSGDFDGDGITDLGLMHWSSTSGWIVIATTSNSDTLKLRTITDGLSKSVNINYGLLTDNNLYTKDTNANYPLMDVQSPSIVVTSALIDNALGTDNVTTYKYGGMKVHKRGRGNLGFRWMETTDQNTGIKSKSEFYQKFPLIGNTKSSESRLSNNQLLNITNTNYVFNGTTCTYYSVPSWELPACTASLKPGVVFPYPLNSSSSQYETNGSLIKTVETNTSQNNFIDNFVGSTINREKTTGPTGLVYEKIVENEYSNNSSFQYHKKDQLSKIVSYSIDRGWQTGKVTKTFSYYDQGQLKSETTEPGTNNWITKTYGYDNYGNQTSVIVSGFDIDTRTSKVFYDNSGLFPEKNENAIGHTNKKVYDSLHGVVTSSTDVNALTTSYSYDNHGRKTASYSPDGNHSEKKREWCDINLGMNCTVPKISNGPEFLDQTISYVVTTYQKRGTTQYTPPVKTYFDKLNRQIRTETVSFDGAVVYVDSNYDTQGRLVAKTSPYFSNLPNEKNPTIYSYDDLGRTIKTITPTGTVVTTAYNGLTTTITTQIFNPTRIESKVEKKDALGRTLSIRDNAYQTIRFDVEYDVQRNHISTTTDPEGNITKITKDKLGRKIAMSDPDMGNWSYTYNVLGEMVSQKDAKNQVTIMKYDALGRMTTRSDADGLISEWTYNDNLIAGNTPRNKAIGKIDTETSTNGYKKDYYYDGLGRPYANIVNINGVNYRTDTTYDTYGRLNSLYYPTSVNGRFTLKHHYKNGFLEKITSTDSATLYWKADFRDEKGQIQYDSFGNNIKTLRTFDEGGRVTWLNIGNTLTNYDASYDYDSAGNLTSRTTQRNQSGSPLIEDYTYDNLSRLKTVSINQLGNINLTYDGKGNIKTKTGVGSYSYYTNRPHAVKNAAGNNYYYDANGNLYMGAGRSISWSSYNKPTYIVSSQGSSEFDYSPSRKRFKHYQTNNSSNTNKTTYYVGGSFEKVVNSSGVTEYKHYLRNGDQTIAIHTRRSNGSTETDYLLRDFQGSTIAVANSSAQIKGQTDFDAFGARRPILGQSVIDSIIGSFPRGYTGHEHLDNLGLIHMNGRVYDPKLGRFLSADPFIQFPNNLQSYNRYSYVLNNPMSYTDPSGFFSWSKKKRHLRESIGKEFSKFFKNEPILSQSGTKKFFMRKENQQIGALIAGVLDGMGCSGACSAGFSAYVTEISGGSYEDMGKGAINSYGSYLISQGANNLTEGMSFPGAATVQGVAGGVSSELQGGKFDEGFGRGFLKTAFPASQSDPVSAAVLGGLISEATGGEFKDGAIEGIINRTLNMPRSPSESELRAILNNPNLVAKIQRNLGNQFFYVGGGLLEYLDLSLTHTQMAYVKNGALKNIGHTGENKSQLTQNESFSGYRLVELAYVDSVSKAVSNMKTYSKSAYSLTGHNCHQAYSYSVQ